MQAVIITAHHNLKQTYELVNVLAEKFEIYLHIDKKVPLKEIEESGLQKIENIKIFNKYSINWGGANLLWGILYMIHEALKNEDIKYFHIISGEDWPARDVQEIYDYFENNSNVYHVCVKLKDFQGKKNYYFRKMQQYYSFLNLLDYKKIPQKLFVKAFVALQTCMGVNRLRRLDIELARGLVWGEFPRAAMEYCMQYAYEHPDFLVFLEYGFASEEFFFGTILMNSEYWKDRVVQNNFRYIVWEKRNGSFPAILDEQDVIKIEEGDYMFIRKVRKPISDELIQALQNQNAKRTK